MVDPGSEGKWLTRGRTPMADLGAEGKWLTSRRRINGWPRVGR